MSALHTVNPGATCASAGTTLTVDVNSATWGALPPGITRQIPPAISREQAYYWSARWQSEIAGSRAALEAGDFREFDNGGDLVRWLLSEEV